METRVVDIVERTVVLFKIARKSVADAMESLYELKISGEWKKHNESWSDFCQEKLDASKGYASQLGSSWVHYVIEGGATKEDIEGIDITKLHAAIKIDMPIEEKLKMLRTSTRREIKEVHNEIAPHTHQPICRVCHIAL